MFSSTCRESVSQPSSYELACERVPCLVEMDVVSSVNDDSRLGWRAQNYSAFWGRSLQDGVTYRLGTLEPKRTVSTT